MFVQQTDELQAATHNITMVKDVYTVIKQAKNEKKNSFSAACIHGVTRET